MIAHLRRSVLLHQVISGLVITIGWLVLMAPGALGEDSSLRGRQQPIADSVSLWPHEKSDLSPDPLVFFGRLDNGFRYVLMQNHRPKSRVSMHLYIHAGSLFEEDDQQGLAHFLEHMLFNGTTHFPPGELVKYFQSIGMQFGPDANGHTGFDETVYDILLPSGSAESIEGGLRVMRDYADGALLLPDEIDKEKRVVLAEKRSRDSVGYRTFVASFEFKFNGSRIAKRLPIGTEEDIRHADRNRLKDFYDTWYRPEHMVLVVVGDFQPEEAEKKIVEAFRTFTPRGPPRKVPDLGRIRHHGIQSFYHHEKEAGNTTVSIETVRKIPAVADSLEVQREYLLEMVGNRILQQRLDDLVRKPNASATSAATGSWRFLRHFAMSTLEAECEPRQWVDTLVMLEQSLRTALTYGFSPSEMNREKKDLLSELKNAVKEKGTRESQELAQSILRHIGADRVFMSPDQELGLLGPVLENLTIDEINRAFKKVWSPEHRLVSVTGNAPPDGDNGVTEERIAAIFRQSTEVAVHPPEEDDVPPFPYLPEPADSAQVVSRIEHDDIGVVQVTFQNGTRLNVKKTDFKANEVQVRINFGDGESVQPRDKPGLSNLASAVLNESGLGTLEKMQLEKAFAGKQTSVDFGIDPDCFYFQGASTSEEVALLFQLLYAHFEDPGIRADALERSRQRLTQKINEMARTPMGAASDEGVRFFAGGDNRFGLPSAKEVASINIDDIRRWLLPKIQGDPLEISVVGDFSPDLVVELAGKYFGTQKRDSGGTNKVSRPLPDFPAAASLTVRLDTKIPSALVVVAWPTDDIWNISRTRRLNILADLFSDRLREKVREKLGAAYSPFAFNRPSRAYNGYGVFSAFIEVSPKEVDTVVSAVREIAADLNRDGITADELIRAVKPVRTSIRDMLRTNRYWLNTVLSGSERHPEQLDWNRTIYEDYGAISQKDLEDLAAVYLDNRKAAIFVALPK